MLTVNINGWANICEISEFYSRSLSLILRSMGIDFGFCAFSAQHPNTVQRENETTTDNISAKRKMNESH